MRFGPWIAAAGVAALMGAGTAQAAPLRGVPASTLQTAIDTGPAPQIELIRGRCGFGEHRSYSGYCHYNHGFRGRIRARHNYYRRHYY